MNWQWHNLVLPAYTASEPQSANTGGSAWQQHLDPKCKQVGGQFDRRLKAPGVESITRDGAVLIKRQLPRWGSALARPRPTEPVAPQKSITGQRRGWFTRGGTPGPSARFKDPLRGRWWGGELRNWLFRRVMIRVYVFCCWRVFKSDSRLCRLPGLFKVY